MINGEGRKMWAQGQEKPPLKQSAIFSEGCNGIYMILLDYFWYSWVELNNRPTDPQSDALTN